MGLNIYLYSKYAVHIHRIDFYKHVDEGVYKGLAMGGLRRTR